MATAAVQNRRPTTSAGRPPNLPVIEHPRSRLGDKNALNIRGSNRGDLITPLGHVTPPSGHGWWSGQERTGLGSDPDLPPLRKGEGMPMVAGGIREMENRQRRMGGESVESGVVEELKRGKHSRMLTWPPVHEQQAGRKRPHTTRVQGVFETPRRKYITEELHQMIQEKLTTGYYGLQQLFRANDPQGNSVVSKVALTRILYHLVGYLTRDEVEKLLTRLGLDELETVSFDSFISCFRDNETVKREWLSPVARKELSAERKKNHLEDHLCSKKSAPTVVSASYANALLKEKCKHSDFELGKHLAPSCFEPSAVILPPQLEECLASIGVRLDEYEMQKLWERYDLKNIGAVSSSWFFQQIGLDNRGRCLSRAKTAPPRVRNQPRTPWVPHIPEESAETPVESRPIELQIEQPSTDVPSPPSVDVVSFLLRKMEHNYHSFLMGFEHFDYCNDGTVSRSQFREVLQEYDLPMVPAEMERLLERVGLRTKDGRVNYRDFLHKFMSRMNNGIAHRVVMDGTHRFNTRSQTPAGNLTAQDVEAKLVELFHKDFLRLLATLKSQDQYNLKLITQKQFRDGIDRVFGIRMTDVQLDQILTEMGIGLDDLVPYPEFLTIFNRKRPPLVLRSPTPRPQSQPAIERTSPYQAPRIPTPEDYIVPPNLAGSVDFGDHSWQKDGREEGAAEMGKTKKKGFETRYRSVKEMEDMIEELLRRRGYEAQDAYHKIDRKATGRLSKTQLHQWLQELGFLLHPTELQTLWTALDIAKDGLVHYAELFDYFNRAKRSEVAATSKSHPHCGRQSPAQETRPQCAVRKHLNKVASRDFFGTPAENIIQRIRPQVLRSWAELKTCLREIDPQGVATVSIPQFKALLHHVNINMSSDQLDRLCSQFDFSQNGQFHYLQFLQLFVDPNSQRSRQPVVHVTNWDEKGRNEMTVSSAVVKIRKQLLQDWKGLRRAFKKADLNRDGFLSVPEFRSILSESKINFNEEDFYHIVSQLDRNLDGRISYDEFIHSMMSVGV